MQLLKTYNDMLMYQRQIAQIIGSDLLDPTFKHANPRLFYLLLSTIIYFLVNSYSLALFSDELLSFTFCLVTYSFGIQCGDKMRIYIFNVPAIMAINNSLVTFYTDNEKLPIEMQKEIMKQLKICNTIMKFINYLYFVILILLIICPFILMLTTNSKHVLIFGFVFPWLDYESSPGYEINLVYQISEVIIAAMGASISDALNVCYVFQSRIQIHVLILKLKYLNERIVEGASYIEQGRILDDIIAKHTTVTWYMRKVDDNFSKHFLIFILTAATQVIITSFVLLTTTWYIGFSLLVQGEVQLLMVCLLGTIISSKCDDLTVEIYNIQWYSMSISDQKKIIILLNMAQHPIEPSLGGLNELNLHTFLEVNKSIYSYLMVFLNFV